MVVNTAFKYETQAEALNDTESWTQVLDEPMRRRTLSPKTGKYDGNLSVRFKTEVNLRAALTTRRASTSAICLYGTRGRTSASSRRTFGRGRGGS